MDELEKKKLQLQLMKMDTNILEYEVKIQERQEDIKRLEHQIELCKKSKQELENKLK